eukprot:TRINITY_DN84911_c0_g1_i1.p1 TRINITY_DN84911_c0_g1~~TRINITY_DN84911_c0_g1_i1.p1  ORF type:complete len:203 (+),score=24.99 TRINITY_DN84911_c0_g1_i1:36-611(+)
MIESTVTSFILTGVTDVICQAIEIRGAKPSAKKQQHGKEQANIEELETSFDLRRTTRYAFVFGIPYGIAAHFWYPFIERCIPGNSFGAACAKTALDCGVFNTLLWPPLMFADHIVEGDQPDCALEKAKNNVVPLLFWTACVWVPIDMACYLLLSASAQEELFWEACFFLPGIITCYFQHRPSSANTLKRED